MEIDHRLRRRKAERRGHVAEYAAALLLLLKGYRIVALRYRTKVGEIDLIARKGDLVVFVEVKARVGEREAVDAVSVTAQRRIRSASDVWLSRRADAARLSQRYDVVAVLPKRLPRHFPDAF
ncbi:YraN family protein [Neorhizobium sp. T786]|uniref:YraN family protein n=1 Tax=Pseudorhizobium xiangyangii TaxID=2883104 RepID=UPI001CFFAEB6|nr:YraN family protein [Neorhizobium xiangyangii]MCB5201513.1 YraN family protein [Neorhizobium xiangyangii]